MGLTVESKVLALVQERFLWQFLYLEMIQGVLDTVPRGSVGTPAPLELAALPATQHLAVPVWVGPLMNIVDRDLLQ